MRTHHLGSAQAISRKAKIAIRNSTQIRVNLPQPSPGTSAPPARTGDDTIGIAAMRTADPIRLAEPSLVHLRESLEVTSFVAVMGNRGPTIMRFEEPGLPVTVNVRAGSVMSLLWSATGRLFLAFLDESRVRKLAEEELAGAPADLRALLDPADPIGRLQREVLDAGCASVRDTNLRGNSAVAAPLFDVHGHLVATLTALGATGGFDSTLDGPIAIAVREEAKKVSAQLGFSPDKPTI